MRQVDFPWRLSWNVTQEDWYFKYPIFVHGCTLIYQLIEIRTTQLKEKWHMLFLCFAVHGGSKSFLILLGSTIPSRIHNHTHDTYSLLHVYPLHIKIGKILRLFSILEERKSWQKYTIRKWQRSVADDVLANSRTAFVAFAHLFWCGKLDFILKVYIW